MNVNIHRLYLKIKNLTCLKMIETYFIVIAQFVLALMTIKLIFYGK